MIVKYITYEKKFVVITHKQAQEKLENRFKTKGTYIDKLFLASKSNTNIMSLIIIYF